jgi:hypothetical protein
MFIRACHSIDLFVYIRTYRYVELIYRYAVRCAVVGREKKDNYKTCCYTSTKLNTVEHG